jgi:glycosyltransferase involved in cell wall biosynthesis
MNAWCGPAKWYLHWFADLGRLLETLKPDVIDLWEEPWSLLAAQVSFLRDRVLPTASLVIETEQNIFKNLPPPFEWFRRYSLARADFCIGRNREAVEVIRKKHFKGPAAIVGNGVDTDLFCAQDKAACRKAAGLSGFVVGYAGRLVPEKGLELLLEAVRRIPGQRCLWVSGDGPMRDRLLAEPFVKWAGQVPREDLPKFYGALDVLVLPSQTTPAWKEQFGRVLVEAQACGISVLGSDSGAIPEVVGSAGLIFPENDLEGLEVLLNRFRCEPELPQCFSLAAKRQVESLYSW